MNYSAQSEGFRERAFSRPVPRVGKVDSSAELELSAEAAGEPGRVLGKSVAHSKESE